MYRDNPNEVIPRPAPAAPIEEKIEYLLDLQERLVKIWEQLIGQVPIVIEPQLLPAYASITIEPRTITDFIQVVAPLGKCQSYSVAFTMAAPAGTTSQYIYRLPSGWVSIIRLDYIYTSDFYDPNLTLEAWIEEERRPVTLGPLPLTGPRSMKVEMVVKHYGMDWELVNATATDALITLELQALWLEKSYYEDFYKPLIEKIYNAAEALIR